MMPGLHVCRECEVYVSFEPVCPLCKEIAHWAEVNRTSWRTVAGFVLAFLYAIAVGIGLPYLLGW